MPDLNTKYAWSCETNKQWETTVLSSDGQTKYLVHWARDHHPDRVTEFRYTCTCKGFANRGTCKHVTTVTASGIRCGWDERMDGGEPRYGTDGRPYCPQCARVVSSYGYGV